MLASLYYTGRGVERNTKRAAELYAAAAAKGLRSSQANLGLMYQKGDGVEQDMAKAISYFEAAAKQGDVQASYQLGQIYRKGDGVPMDFTRTLAYYKMGALQGDIPSANEYGLCFVEGAHVDYVEAYGWLSYAAKGGSKDTALDQLRKLLGDKIGQTEVRAREIAEAMPKGGPASP